MYIIFIIIKCFFTISTEFFGNPLTEKDFKNLEISWWRILKFFGMRRITSLVSF